MLAALAFLGRAEAVSESERIAFAGVDSLAVEVYLSDRAKGFVTEKSLRTKAELILRSTGVPLDADGYDSWLQISVVASEVTFEGGRGTGDWIYAVKIQLYEVVPIWRDGRLRFLSVVTWDYPLLLGSDRRLEARDRLLDNITEAAEEASNLYLATR